MQLRNHSRIAFLFGSFAIGLAGCGKTNSTETTKGGTDPAGVVPASARGADPTPSAPLTPAQLEQAKPNETGVVPILEYHDVVPKEASMRRSIVHFKSDLERLYQEGYYPVALKDYLDNRIAAPLGKSPVIFTFDDARESQFKYLPDGTIDPDCALGILQAFRQKHPDFPVKASFYVLPRSAFGQPKFAAKKLQELLAEGQEIGNHTVTHTALKSLSDTDVQKELAGCVTLTQKLVPQVKMETMALPLGSAPKNRALAASGEYQGQRYTNRAVLLVGAQPAPSPVSPKYNPLKLPRVQATEGVMGITYWLDYLKQHPERRYVSDGDPNSITVPKASAEKVDKSKLNGAILRVYRTY